MIDFLNRPVMPPADTRPANRKCCGKCAFRRGSPERGDPYGWSGLMEAFQDGTPFYCHESVPAHPQEEPHGERWRLCAGWNAHKRTGFCVMHKQALEAV